MTKNMSVIFYGRLGCDYSSAMLKYLNHSFNNVISCLDGDEFNFTDTSELFYSDYDIILAFRSRFLVPKHAIDKSKISINFHPGPPEHPGSACVNWALYNSDEFYGATAHLIDEKIDSGKIINVVRFPIFENDTVTSLLDRTYRQSHIQFCKVVDEINSVMENRFTSDERWLMKARLMKSLDEINFIDNTMSNDEIIRRIRATNHPNHPTKFIVSDKVFYINVAIPPVAQTN